MSDKWVQLKHSLSLLNHASSLLVRLLTSGSPPWVRGSLCPTYHLMMAERLARHPVTNIVAFFLAPLLRITVTSLFLRKQKLRKSLSYEVLIKDQHCEDEGGSSTKRKRWNRFTPDKFDHPYEDIWSQCNLSAFSNIAIDLVDSLLDMRHIGKAWPWVRSFSAAVSNPNSDSKRGDKSFFKE